MKLLGADGAIYQLLSRLWDMVKLTLIFLVTCLPVFTIGPALSAMYSVALHLIDNEEGYVVREYLKAFKANWKNGLPLGLFSLLLYLSVALDFILYFAVKNAGEQGAETFMFLGIGMYLCISFVLLYLFPLTARYENSFRRTVKNSRLLAMRYPVKSLLLVVCLTLELLAFAFNLTTMLIFVLIGPSCLCFTVAVQARDIFKLVEKGQQKEEGAGEKKDDTWEGTDKNENEPTGGSITRAAHINKK